MNNLSSFASKFLIFAQKPASLRTIELNCHIPQKKVKIHKKSTISCNPHSFSHQAKYPRKKFPHSNKLHQKLLFVSFQLHARVVLYYTFFYVHSENPPIFLQSIERGCVYGGLIFMLTPNKKRRFYVFRSSKERRAGKFM